jgi:hypothetical protein
MITLDIPLPGPMADGTAYLDIETRKVDFGLRLSDGWIAKKRWSPFAIGIGRADGIHLRATYEEAELLKSAAELIGYRTVVYAGTRQFDEMVLKGRFINARRAIEPIALYPTLPGASAMRWRNIQFTKGLADPPERSADIESRLVPTAWCEGQEKRELVLIHLLRDVAELMFKDGKCVAANRAWVRRVLYSNEYALNLIRKAAEQ